MKPLFNISWDTDKIINTKNVQNLRKAVLKAISKGSRQTWINYWYNSWCHGIKKYGKYIKTKDTKDYWHCVLYPIQGLAIKSCSINY